MFSITLTRLRWKKSSVLSVISIEETLILSIIGYKCGSKDEKIFKENESTKILKIYG